MWSSLAYMASSKGVLYYFRFTGGQMKTGNGRELPQAHGVGREEQMLHFILFSDMWISLTLTAVEQTYLSSMICILYYSASVSNSSYCIHTKCN